MPGLLACCLVLWIHVSGKRHTPRGRSMAVTKSPHENLQGKEPLHPDPDSYAGLVRAVQAGSQDAMETLLMRAQEVAYRFSLLVCGRPDDADDAMQEALLKTYRYAAPDPRAGGVPGLAVPHRPERLPDRPPQARARAGSPAVARRDRRVTATGTTGHVDAVDPARDPERQAINVSLRGRLRRALAGPPAAVSGRRRPARGRGAVDAGGADVVGISEANVKTRLHRARVLLREQLDAS